MIGYMSFTTVEQVIDYARTKAYVNSSQVPNTQGLGFFNEVQKEMEECIANFINTTYLNEEVFINLVAGTPHYALPTGTPIANPTVPQLKNLLQIGVRYTTTDNGNIVWLWSALTTYQVNQIVEYNGDWFVCLIANINNAPTNTTYWKVTLWPTYYKARQETYSNLANEDSYSTVNQDFHYPFFMLRGNNIRLFPTPFENVADGLKLHYARTDLEVQIANISNTSTFNALTIPRWYQYVTVKGIIMLIHESRAKTNERDKAELKYREALQDMIYRVAQRFNQPEESELPDLTYLMY